MARPRRYIQMVDASRDEACLAARLFNDPSEIRSFEGFVVHMHLAWLYLLHAEFERNDVDTRYWLQEGNRRRLDRVDGEAKRWDLAQCVRRRWSNDSDPVRANLTFFIGLRNKIEHRYARQQQALATAVGGEAQALLLNYENEIVDQFGISHSLATRLRFPIFIGSFTDAGERALRTLRQSLPAPLRGYIADYHARLDPDVANDQRYEMRLRIFPEVANRPSKDVLPLQFFNESKMTDEQRQFVSELGKRGVVVVRDRKRDVIGADHLRPQEAAAMIAREIPYKFTTRQFSRAWQILEVRPPSGSSEPSATKSEYCTYDRRHRDYGYRPAFVDLLIAKCSTELGFRKLFGTAPRDKFSNEWVGEPPPGPPWSRRAPIRPS